jgi:signal transduction histidine kinase
MLLDFIRENRAELIRITRETVRVRSAPRPTAEELETGVPLFLSQFTDLLVETKDAQTKDAETVPPTVGAGANEHGVALLRRGFTIAQVVHDYGDICQAITELAIVQKKQFSTLEFHILNLCLDNAIAEAVTGYSRQRERNISADEVMRLGSLAHELRNELSNATLAFQILKGGSVAIGGSTGALLDRSLAGLRGLIDRSMAEVRLAIGQHKRTRVVLAEFIEEMEIAAAIDAKARNLELIVTPVDYGIAVQADRQLLGSAVSNLMHNAFKLPPANGRVSLRTLKAGDHVLIEVEDECGGLPPGKAEELFRPFDRRGADKTGLGLGLSISQKSVDANGGQIHVQNKPGKGCVFTIELPIAA